MDGLFEAMKESGSDFTNTFRSLSSISAGDNIHINLNGGSGQQEGFDLCA